MANPSLLIMLGASGGAAAQGVGRYADVNGLRMNYEVHGDGFPLVILPGGHGDYMGEITTLKPGQRHCPVLAIIEEFLADSSAPTAR